MFAQTTIIGYLGKDPETRAMPNGNSVTNFSVATTERWKDKQSGEKKEQTEWHNLVAFGKLADVISEYLKKGSLVHIIGRPRTDKVEGRDGTTKYFHKIIVDRMTMLPVGSRPQQGTRDEAGDDRGTGGENVVGQGGGAEGFDDDIPF